MFSLAGLPPTPSAAATPASPPAFLRFGAPSAEGVDFGDTIAGAGEAEEKEAIGAGEAEASGPKSSSREEVAGSDGAVPGARDWEASFEEEADGLRAK